MSIRIWTPEDVRTHLDPAMAESLRLTRGPVKRILGIASFERR